jgi:diguanylate cyclase (GGDEF)-like protein/putative nucleotidyltransferase with HDIG domain
MSNRKWKSLPLTVLLCSLAVAISAFSVSTLWNLPLFGTTDRLFVLLLVALTLLGSQIRIRVPDAEGFVHLETSVADTFILLSALVFSVSTSGAVAASGLCVVAGGVSRIATSRGATSEIRTASLRAISITVGATLFAVITGWKLYWSGAEVTALPTLGTLFLPLLAIAVLQFVLTIAGPVAISLYEKKIGYLEILGDGLVWAGSMQIANVSAAAMLYTSLREHNGAYLVTGFLILPVVPLLFRLHSRAVLRSANRQSLELMRLRETAELHMNAIESLAIAIDAKDQTTHGHVGRTRAYATGIGRLLNLSEGELQALYAGALLHDIGKLAVPDYILNKPGKLTDSEFSKMKIHPTVGGDIVKRMNFPYPVEDIVRYHHEKWDGSGYPSRLSGKDIPLVARIISVVDFYDSTRCDRPYRSGMTRADSLGLLMKMSGAAFDPMIVDAFVGHIDEFDSLISRSDLDEQVEDEGHHDELAALPVEINQALIISDDSAGFQSITEAQREVFALYEIAQTIGASLSVDDTIALICSKLPAIVPFDTCVIYLVDHRSGKAVVAHAEGANADSFADHRINIGEGVTGWVIANARTMSHASPELDLRGMPEVAAESSRGIVATPLMHETRAFGAITLYSKTIERYNSEHMRLLESVAQHVSSALNNALTFEKTRDGALTDNLTDLPNARAFYMVLDQRIAECQRIERGSLAVLSIDIDDFRDINSRFGHAAGDRVLTDVSAEIKRELRQMDILARYAGDEFVAIMPIASSLTAAAVAERIRFAVESKMFPVKTGTEVEVGLSIGVSSFPEDGETSEQLLSAAAENMRRNKQSRKLLPALAEFPVSSFVR